MKRYWWIIIPILSIVLLVGWRIARARARATQSGADAYTSVKVTRGSLTVTVDASGKIAPAETVDLYPSQEARVMAVPIEAGDSVKTGQVLVRLDAYDAEIRVRQASDALAAAEARLDTARESAVLSPVQAGKERDRARAAVSSAKIRLQQLRTGASAEEIAQAEAALNQARLAQDAAKSDYERTHRLYEAQAATKQQLDAARNKYETACESLVSAQARLKQLRDPAEAEDLAAAEASLAQAEADLAIAEENLRHAGQADQVASAEAEARKARDTLATARKDAAGMVVVAPFDGLVTQVTAKVGAYVSRQGALVSLANPGALVAEVEVDESDIVRLEAGQAAVLTVQALPDEEYEGRVLSIGGMGHDQGGVVYFTVKIAVIDPVQRVKPGMTADAIITLTSRTNVLIVPNGALETRMGWTVARLYGPDGKITFRRVSTGLRTETSTEITDGLRAGETVAVLAFKSDSTSQNQSRQDGGMAPFGGMMRMRR